MQEFLLHLPASFERYSLLEYERRDGIGTKTFHRLEQEVASIIWSIYLNYSHGFSIREPGGNGMGCLMEYLVNVHYFSYLGQFQDFFQDQAQIAS